MDWIIFLTRLILNWKKPIPLTQSVCIDSHMYDILSPQIAMPAMKPYSHESLLIEDLKMQLQDAAKTKGTSITIWGFL